eukprot:COSAG02_NODE_610_length_19566_cov_39.049622_1_plen_93_part_00
MPSVIRGIRPYAPHQWRFPLFISGNRHKRGGGSILGHAESTWLNSYSVNNEDIALTRVSAERAFGAVMILRLVPIFVHKTRIIYWHGHESTV